MTIKCINCNETINSESEKCPYCGHDLTKYKQCTACGELLEKSDLYCPYCGVKQPEVIKPNEIAPAISKKTELDTAIVEEPEESHNKGYNLILALLFVVIIALGGAIIIMNSKTSQSTSKTKSEQAFIDEPAVDLVVEDTTAVDTLAEEYNDSNEMHTSEYVVERIKNMYGKEEFLASDFSRLRKKVKDYLDALNSDDYNTEYLSNVEWIDFWFVGDDGGCGEPELSIGDIQIGQDDGYAVTRWYYKECDCYTNMSLSLIFENGNWFVDDVSAFGCSGITIESIRNKTKEYINNKGLN